MATTDSQELPVENGLSEGDLSDVACQAAIELDDLILDRARGVEAVGQLASLISHSILTSKDAGSSNWLLDPSAFVVVNRALQDTHPSTARSVQDLVQEAGTIVDRFAELKRDPQGFRKARQPELEKMRSFCLALSRQASGSKKSPIDWVPRHPFRR